MESDQKAPPRVAECKMEELRPLGGRREEEGQTHGGGARLDFCFFFFFGQAAC